jgi:hypothetical protein
MALSASKISAVSSSGAAAAAASTHPLSGGRGVSNATQAPVEGVGFSTQIGVNDNNILRDDSQSWQGFDRSSKDGTWDAVAYTALASDSFQAGSDDRGGTLSLADILHGIDQYEYNIQIISPKSVRVGQVFNRYG